MMKEIRGYLKEKPLAPNVTLETVTIFEVSRDPTNSIFSSLASEHLPQLEQAEKNAERHLFVHFGVHGSASTFLLEQNAWNEMDFRVPDQKGYQPRQMPICETDGPTSNSLLCRLPLESIYETLCDRHGKDQLVKLSTDPGRFLCNYLYYISLSETLKYPNAHSLFVHVPPFDAIPKEKQLSFIHELLEQLCSAACE